MDMKKPPSRAHSRKHKRRKGDKDHLAAQLAPLEEQDKRAAEHQIGSHIEAMNGQQQRDYGAIVVDNANLHVPKDMVEGRDEKRFLGIEPEPRPQLRSGHIPHSMNLPHTELIAEDGTLLPPSRLQQKLESAGIDLSRPVVTSCGSGVTACTLALGLYQIGIEQVAVYDGSWSEWGGRQDTPINAA